MASLYLWQYFLVVPADACPAANAVAPALGNPSLVEQTFRRYPAANDQGEYTEPAAYWAASFLATDTAAQGTPSREALETSLGQLPALEALRWVRTRNPEHPDTAEAERDTVIASNWEAFPVGATVNWEAITQALDPIPQEAA